MSVWLTIPSKRPVEQVEPVLKMWRERGYGIALFRDDDDEILDLADHCQWGKYGGYGVAVNGLILEVMENHPDAEWFVCAGDDTFPDPNHSAEEIAESCKDYFSDLHHTRCEQTTAGAAMSRMLTGEQFETFGVMQPTGDRWGEDRNSHAFEPMTPGCDSCNCRQCGQGPEAPRHIVGAYIDRVCGSPWIGREFAARMYRGTGPYWPEYTHMGVDEELQHVAIKIGVLWQRPDLTHFHNHWGRAPAGQRYGSGANIPEFLKEANSIEQWDRYKRIFNARKAAGFPGHEPVA